MLEMCERWVRSVGIDLFDLVMVAIRHETKSLRLKFLGTLCVLFRSFYDAYVAVLLLNVAIKTTSRAVILLIVIS